MEPQENLRPGVDSTTRIGEILVRAKLISREQLDKALQRQKNLGSGRLGEHLVTLGFITEKDLTQQLARQFGIPLVDPTQLDIVPEVLGLLPPALIRKHHLLPLSLIGSTLTVAMADPTNIVIINEVKFLTGYDVRVSVAPERAIEKAIERLFENKNVYGNVLDRIDSANFEVMREQESVDLYELEQASEDAPVIALVNALFADAIKKRASDVHVEPYEKFFRVRFRIDGVLQEIMKPPVKLKNAIVSRIKILSELDVAERRLAQDGRIRLRMGPGRDVDVRVNIIPTFAGEKVVMRILDKSAVELDLSKLGMSEGELAVMRDAFTRPQGMLLVTGPTGSGKTTTLYSVLTELNKTTINISTAEDPIEYNLPGINQVQIHDAIGRSFSYCLRAFLRQDPDVIMVGEIRDFETAEIALKAALTGHMVLSTLHTNDAPSTIARLLNIGLEPFLLSSALNLVIAQRLMRRLCPRCRQPLPDGVRELIATGMRPEDADGATVYQPTGCDECSGTGYRGRVAVYEMLRVTNEVANQILQVTDGGASLKRLAIEQGMRTLRHSGLEKVRQGITTIEEVVRVTTPD